MVVMILRHDCCLVRIDDHHLIAIPYQAVLCIKQSVFSFAFNPRLITVELVSIIYKRYLPGLRHNHSHSECWQIMHMNHVDNINR